MALSIKKAMLSGVVALFVCFSACAMSSKMCIDDWEPCDIKPSLVETTTSENSVTVVTETHFYQAAVIPNESYDTVVETCTNKSTGDILHHETRMYHDEPGYVRPVWNEELRIYIPQETVNDIDSQLPPCNVDVSDQSIASHETLSHDHTHDHLKDVALGQRRQEIAENEMRQREVKSNASINQKSLEATFILHTGHTVDDLIPLLSSPTIQAHFQRVKCMLARAHIKKGTERIRKGELKFLDALMSGQVTQLLDQTQHPNLKIAQIGFDELKELWSETGKSGFKQLLGVDVMKIAEKGFITRQDYIAKYADAQTLKTIQEYEQQCYLLQKKGDINGFFSVKNRLLRSVRENGSKSDFVTNVCLAIVENYLDDPITCVFSTIKNTPSLEAARRELQKLEDQVLYQVQEKNIILADQIKQWSINQYGFDVLEAAQSLYKSRADYVAIPKNQSALSDDLVNILANIEHMDLPAAHAELVHFDVQIMEAFKERNFTDSVAQKKCLVKNFGSDVLEAARTKYQQRSDHIDLVKSFIPLDVQMAMVEILERNDNYASVAAEMTTVADTVFANARLCKLSFVSKVEPQIYNSIEAMRTAQDCPTFIVNLAIVSHTIGDVQAHAWAIVKGEMALLVRAPELLERAIEKFIFALNPVTQLANMGNFVSDAGYLLKKGLVGSVDALFHPIATTQKGIKTTVTLFGLIWDAGHFVSDVTIGIFYLQPAEYQKCVNIFCETVAPIQDVRAEQVVDFGAQVAADMVFCSGVSRGYNYLKELDVISKISEYTAPIARTFKKAVDTHLADNPILVTAEGFQVKISNTMNNLGGPGKEIINSSKALVESAYAKIAIELESEISAIRQLYSNAPNGFAEFAHKPIRIAYKHILGMEINLNKKGKLSLSGFHHDLKNAIEKSGTIKFVNKIFNEHGCYSAELIMDGLRVPKTFFPAHWPREKVVSKIHEAYNNFIKSGVIPELGGDGKYFIRALTNVGMEIEMYFTIGGEMKTAYPRLPVEIYGIR